jgi:hypothetical protein
MSSEFILPPDLTIVPEKDCPVANKHETESTAINTSTQINLKETPITTCAVVETSTEKGDETAIDSSEDTNNVEREDKHEKRKAATNDSASEIILKESTAEIAHLGKEATTAKFGALTSNVDYQKSEFINRRIAKQFRVFSANKIHTKTGGKVNKIFFGTVDGLVPGKVEEWRILYDDGDVDIMSRKNLLDAIRYYDATEKYDTNHAHKLPISPLLLLTGEKDGKGGNDTASSSRTKSQLKNFKATAANPPKKGRKIKAKIARKEPLPEWTGPPDEDIDGGWPKGVSSNDCFVSVVENFPI